MSKLLTYVSLASEKLTREERVLILADVHEQIHKKDIETYLSADPTVILIPGDFIENTSWEKGSSEKMFGALRSLSSYCPVYYSLGNHEIGCLGKKSPCGMTTVPSYQPSIPVALSAQIKESGARLLDNTFEKFHDLVIGGVSAAGEGYIDFSWMPMFTAESGFHLLLCHHPEYYDKYIRTQKSDLTVSGHAHGGHIRLFGQGLYAPGQGLFPKLTAGFYDDKHLFISRGLGNQFIIPRFFNPREAVLMTLRPLNS